MKVLFAHRYLPGQFRHVAAALAARGDACVFLHADGDETPPGVRAVRFRATRRASSQTHHYLQGLENAVLDGQAAYRVARELSQSGFRPDVIFAHAGFGPGLYLAEAFRGAPILGHFEWFYSAHGADADFIDPAEVTPDDELRIRTRNAQLLLELEACRRGVVPTEFQLAQFPQAYRHKLAVLHEGIDTDFFTPVREVIADRETGLLADLRDPAAIACAIAALLDDRALGARLGARAREVAVERYALTRLLPRQIALVEDVSRQAQPWISMPKRTRSRSGPSRQSEARLNRVK